MGGAGAAGVSTAGYGAGKYVTDPSKTSASRSVDDAADATYTERSYKLGSGSPNQSAPLSSSSADDYSSAARTAPGVNYSQHAASSGTFFGANSAARRYGMDEVASHQPHLGRDVAIGGTAAGIGAGALGEYEASKKPDPELERATYTDRAYYVGESFSESNPHVPGEFPTEDGQDPHDPRRGADAAIGGAGLGAAGAGAAGYEAEKDRHDPSNAQYSEAKRSQPVASEYPIQTTTNTMRRSIAGVQEGMPEQKRYHNGRDAAVAASVGPAGVGAYDLSKDPRKIDSAIQGQTIANNPKATPVDIQSQPSTTAQKATPALTPSTQQEQQHNGRDAAVVGGAGARGVGAYELAKDRERKQQPQSMSGQPKTTTTTTTNTVMSAASSKPADKKSEIQQPVRSWETRNDPDFGRDIAIAGAGTGAAGIGAYEASKRHEQKSPTSQYTDSTPQQHDKHYGRDAAIGGGTGMAVAAAFEASKRHDGSALTSNTAESQQGRISNVADRSIVPEKETSTTSSLPDKSNPETAHGLESRAGKGDHHYSRDAAVAGGTGAAGLGTYDGYKRGEDRKQDTPSTASQMTATQGKEDSHVYGRDAAIAGGTGAAAGTGTYEAAKHHEDRQQDLRTQQPLTQHSTTETPTTQKEDDRYHDRDGVIAGGAGAAGVGIYEGAKHHDERQAAEQQQQQQQHSAIVAQDSSGHNKLHKKSDTRHQEEKHDRDLQKAREREAAAGGDKGEKKESLLHKILHPGRKSVDEPTRPSQTDTAAAAGTTSGTETGGAVAMRGHSPDQSVVSEGKVIEPHTGLPMDITKDHTSGAGGTDAAQQIEGYHELDATEGAGQTDWERIKKGNSLY